MPSRRADQGGRQRLFVIATIPVAIGLATLAGPAVATAGFTVQAPAASPSPVAPGTSTMITTAVTNTGSVESGILVDLEVYTAGGVRVFQKWTTNLTFAAGQQRSLQWIWPVPADRAAGIHAIKIGVFAENWSQLYTWSNSAGTVTVGTAGPASFIAKVGAVTVTCNSRYKALEVEYALRQSDARALVMVDRFPAARIDYLAILRELAPEVDRPGAFRSERFPELRRVIVLGDEVPAAAVAFEAVERAGRTAGGADLARIPVAPDDPAEILYTSGTTGDPKGCLLSHRNMYYKCRVYTDLHGWTAADRYLVPVPYFHIFGSMGGIAANCLAGSTQVVMETFDPGEAMRLIEAERVTIFSGVPTMFITILGHPDFGRHDLRSLRTGSIGAAPVPPEIMRRILDRESGLGMDALVVYGLTEATGGTHWTRPGDSLERRVGTVGLRTPEIEDRVVDPATGRELGPGEEGEVCIKGPTLMLEYYRKPEATREKIRDGWLHTGDMGVKDADGYLRITGRLTDLIILGGFNPYPAEIENVYLRHPGVLDVSIVGVPDPVMGEVVMAFVIPRPGSGLTADEVIAFGRQRIANFKVPRYVELVDAFPMTGSGKVQKFRQQAYAVEKYGLKGPS